MDGKSSGVNYDGLSNIYGFLAKKNILKVMRHFLVSCVFDFLEGNFLGSIQKGI